MAARGAKLKCQLLTTTSNCVNRLFLCHMTIWLVEGMEKLNSGLKKKWSNSLV